MINLTAIMKNIEIRVTVYKASDADNDFSSFLITSKIIAFNLLQIYKSKLNKRKKNILKWSGESTTVSNLGHMARRRKLTLLRGLTKFKPTSRKVVITTQLIKMVNLTNGELW